MDIPTPPITDDKGLVRVRVPISVLRKSEDDGVMLLRFGAATNAVNAMVSILVEPTVLGPPAALDAK